MDVIYTYELEDGTKLSLINKGFSTLEIMKLEEIHGIITKLASKEQNSAR